jgi:hypothetical protein
MFMRIELDGSIRMNEERSLLQSLNADRKLCSQAKLIAVYSLSTRTSVQQQSRRDKLEQLFLELLAYLS